MQDISEFAENEYVIPYETAYEWPSVIFICLNPETYN